MKSNRIVGGQTALNPIPWQVSVRQCPSGQCHFCGGTILDAKTVLSAAHCFPQKIINGEYVAAGMIKRLDGLGWVNFLKFLVQYLHCVEFFILIQKMVIFLL